MTSENSEKIEKVYIGIYPERDGSLSFYEVSHRPVQAANVFDTFEDAKSDAKAKIQKRIEALQQKLEDIDNYPESKIIPLKKLEDEK